MNLRDWLTLLYLICFCFWLWTVSIALTPPIENPGWQAILITWEIYIWTGSTKRMIAMWTDDDQS